MSNVISIINHKGGVGKTTTTASLGAVLNRQGYKVLLIDLDGQMNLTISLGVQGTPTMYEAMRGKISTLPIYAIDSGMHIVPSSLDMAVIEPEIQNEPAKDLILASLINPIKKQYDYILIDCPPSLGSLTLNALCASDYFLVPVQSHFLAAQGLKTILQITQKIQTRLKPDLKLLGILLTMYNGRRVLDKKVLELIDNAFKEEIFRTKIRYSISTAEATLVGVDILTYSPNSVLVKEYSELAEEIKSRIKS